MKIQEAYDTLKDPQKRKEYDFRSNAPPDIFFNSNFHQNFHNVEDLDIRLNINLTFEESILGQKKEIIVKRKVPCNLCGGQGSKNFQSCLVCSGKGFVLNQMAGFFKFQQVCHNCMGKGSVGTDRCTGCNGAKSIASEETKIDIIVPAGIMNGMVICVHGMGNVGAEGRVGNINVRCVVSEDKKYTIRGLDIYFNFEVDFSTMLFGGKVEIPTFEGDVIELDIPEKTQNLTNFRVKGKGMPNVHNNMMRGDLVAIIITKIPQKEMLPELKRVLQHHGI